VALERPVYRQRYRATRGASLYLRFFFEHFRALS
jgi:hypothetical protein